MKELHLVGFTAGRDGLVLSARRGSAGGGFKILVDEALADHIDQWRAEHRPTAAAARTRAPAGGSGHGALTPREIQARLRAGQSVDEVATEAGADPSWVERFAAPVLAEQANIVGQATQLPVITESGDMAALPLAEAVAANLADRGIAATDPADGWSAYRLGSSWRVRYTFRQRGRPAQAEWVADLAGRAVTAANPLGAELGQVGAGGAGDQLDEPGEPPPAGTNGQAHPDEAPAQHPPAKRQRGAAAARKAAAREEAAKAKAAAKQEGERERAAARQAAEEERKRQRQADLAAKAAARKEAAAARAAAKHGANKGRGGGRKPAGEGVAGQGGRGEEGAPDGDGDEGTRGTASPRGDQLAFDDVAPMPDPAEVMARLRDGLGRSGQDP